MLYKFVFTTSSIYYIVSWLSRLLSGLLYKFELVLYKCIYYKYSTLPRGIAINIAPKVGIFPEPEGWGKYSLPRVQYISIFHEEGLDIYFIT